MEKKNISTVERRRRILNMLKKHQQVHVADLKKYFTVSEVTLRKDLRYLEEKKLMLRARGGGMLNVKFSEDLSIKEREVLNLDIKKAIAQKAATLINEGDTIIIDSGSTLMQLAKCLKDFRNLTIITNALDIVKQLSEFDGLKIIIPGGVFRKKSFSLVGAFAVDNFQMFRADKYFVSCDGITEDGLFTSNIDEGQVAKTIMANARENIVLADSTKFGNIGVINFSSLAKVTTLVTNNTVSQKYNKIFKHLGVDVILS